MNGANIPNRVKLMNAARLKKRYIKQKALRSKAKNIVSSLNIETKHIQLICSLLFWCEGGKALSGGIHFINSDSIMIRKFLDCLRCGFAVDESKFRVMVHLHDYHNPTEQLSYWSNVTNIPRSQFYKPYLKPHTGLRKRQGYQGCASVRYLDASLANLLQMIYIEYGQT